jgi:hypothetical protein
MPPSPRPQASALTTDGAPTTGWAAARRVIAASARGRARRVTWLTGAAAATSLVAACGSASSSQPAATPTATVTVTSPAAVPSSDPATSPAAAPSSAPASAPSSTPATGPSKPAPSGGAGGLATCRTAALRIAVDVSQADGAAGSTYYPLNFTNTSGTACEVYGFPGVSFATAGTSAGRQIGVAAQRGNAFTKVTVRLAPGQTAHAWLRVVVAANFPASTCEPVTAHWLRVYPPGETAAGYVEHTFNACSSASAPVLSVLPVRAGQGVAGVTP